MATALRKKGGVHVGLYHSLFEWYNPLFEIDKENHFSTQHFTEVCGKVLLANHQNF